MQKTGKYKRVISQQDPQVHEAENVESFKGSLFFFKLLDYVDYLMQFCS